MTETTANLLCKPGASNGLVHDITPASAGWEYVGFGLHQLTVGQAIERCVPDQEEWILVAVEGRCQLSVNEDAAQRFGDRLSVFEQTPPHAIYLPPGTRWTATAESTMALAECRAPAQGGYPIQRIEGIQTETRGKGTNTRYINAIAMEDRDVAERLLVTEVFTPDGHWSSYPPHRHDEDRFPEMTYLEETYYHRLSPASGFGVQRVFTEDGSLDETMAVSDGDVVLVPKGHHPCAAPYGFSMYYLNVMAGPLRKWRFQNHPDFDWIAQRDR